MSYDVCVVVLLLLSGVFLLNFFLVVRVLFGFVVNFFKASPFAPTDHSRRHSLAAVALGLLGLMVLGAAS